MPQKDAQDGLVPIAYSPECEHYSVHVQVLSDADLSQIPML